jgi:hypothetical protein
MAWTAETPSMKALRAAVRSASSDSISIAAAAFARRAFKFTLTVLASKRLSVVAVTDFLLCGPTDGRAQGITATTNIWASTLS